MVLSRFLTMLLRVGKLDEAPQYIEEAEKMGPRAKFSAGLSFCNGLYNQYTNNIRDAIKYFNQARRDGVWGNEALMHMIDIYLNPDNENIWTEGEVGPEQLENIRVATKLLEELSGERTIRLRILEAYVLLSSKRKENVEKATNRFTDILETHDKNYVPAMLGLSIAYTLSGQESKARNFLKRIAKMSYDQKAAVEFEKSYLLLADLYAGRAKYDMVQELCKKALEHNKSCGKTWETMGLVMEKEQSYQDAGESYEKAWKCEGEASATIGFKLAFNYLKAKRYVDTIDVCNKVLDKYPDYPKIRTDILEEAYKGLRP